jgi:ADP-ribose pyrophosphatase YjhB (NUDIX family)
VLEHGETINGALRREVYEETGLTIEPGPLTGVYQNMVRHIVALVFRCRPTGGQLTANEEVSSFRWARPDEVPSLMAEAYAIRVLDGLKGRADTPVRANDGANLIHLQA